MNAIRRLHRAARIQRASIRYVFRVAFGREADWTKDRHVRTGLRLHVSVPDGVKRCRPRTTNGWDGANHAPAIGLTGAHAGSRHHEVIAGVDEAGRGPWAGPVVAAAAILSAESSRALRTRRGQ